MFGRKKMYKKGLADAMQAYEAFGKKQEAALEKIVQNFKNSNKELDAKLKALGEDIIAVYDYLDRNEKAALYKLCTPMDLKELEDPDRRLLIAVLCQLADDEGSRYNPDQRRFINSIRRYLEISNVQTNADYSVIEKIDSLDVQETFMRVCLEFMYLQDSDEMSDDQEEFFDNFSVSKRQAKLIEFDVIRQFHMFGAEGVAEKYGIISLTEDIINGKIDYSQEDTNVLFEKDGIIIKTDKVDEVSSNDKIPDPIDNEVTNKNKMPDPLGDEDEWLNYIYSIDNMAKRHELVMLRCELLKAEREKKLKEAAEAEKAKADEEAENAKACDSDIDKDIAKLKERLSEYDDTPKSTDALSSMASLAHDVVARAVAKAKAENPPSGPRFS